MSSSENNQNFDLKQQALKEFELEDVKELLAKNKKSIFTSKNDFLGLDKDDNSLSETEKKLYEQSKEALDIVKFLEWLIKELEKIEDFKTTYDESEFKNTLEKKKNYNSINKLYENDEFIKYLIKLDYRIQWPIIWICRITLWDWWEWESIKDYLSNIEEYKNKDEFEKILKDINTFINENILSTKEDIKNTEINNENKKLLKEYLKEDKTNIDKIHKDFLSYLKIKKEKLGKKWINKISNNDYEKYLNEFLEKKWINKISDKNLLNKIEDYLIVKKWQKNINYIEQNSKKLYEVLKSWKEEKIDNFFKEVDKNYYSNLENEVKEYEEKERIEKHLESINSEQENSIVKKQNYSFSPESWIITTNENWETDSFKLSEQDRDLIKEKPKLLAQIIEFHKILSELWLSNLWEIKDKIFQAITNKYPGSFELKWDYLNKNETFIFLNAILKSVWKKTIDINSTTVDWFENTFKKKNNFQFNWGMKDDILKKWESNIEEIFFQKYINNFSTFQIWKFTESI